MAHVSKISLVKYRNFANAKLIFNKSINTIIGRTRYRQTHAPHRHPSRAPILTRCPSTIRVIADAARCECSAATVYATRNGYWPR